jgi:hypothetical protein
MAAKDEIGWASRNNHQEQIGTLESGVQLGERCWND